MTDRVWQPMPAGRRCGWRDGPEAGLYGSTAAADEPCAALSITRAERSARRRIHAPAWPQGQCMGHVCP